MVRRLQGQEPIHFRDNLHSDTLFPGHYRHRTRPHQKPRRPRRTERRKPHGQSSERCERSHRCVQRRRTSIGAHTKNSERLAATASHREGFEKDRRHGEPLARLAIGRAANRLVPGTRLCALRLLRVAILVKPLACPFFQNGRIVDAISLFKKNVALHFEGQTECAICYS